MDLGLTGKVFVVTAASQGLGLASAQALVAEGARVVLVARRPEVLASVADDLGAAHLAGDLSSAELPQQAVDLALGRFGRIDGALVSVGGPPRGSVLSVTDEQWTESFGSVFLPAVRTARALYAANPAGRLGLVLSTSARVPLGEMAISNGLRAGLAMLVKELGDEVGPQGGRTIGLMPGQIATSRMEDLFAAADDPGKARQAAGAAIPLGRLGTPEEFGRVAAFTLSDAASYLSGSLIAVDGGLMRTV